MPRLKCSNPFQLERHGKVKYVSTIRRLSSSWVDFYNWKFNTEQGATAFLCVSCKFAILREKKSFEEKETLHRAPPPTVTLIKTEPLDDSEVLEDMSMLVEAELPEPSSIEPLTILEKMVKIDNVSVGPMGKSEFLKPFRMKFTQNNVQRCWDLTRVHDSVAILIFNITRNVFILVKQFRPAVYFKAGFDQAGTNVLGSFDWTQVSPEKGLTVELCAGILDKGHLSDKETAQEEVLEECGYVVPLANFEFVTKIKSGVGTTGSNMSLFYVEVEDEMKVTEGGGNVEEGELIEVLEMTIPEMTDYINQKCIQSPGDFAFAITWFLLNKRPQTDPKIR